MSYISGTEFSLTFWNEADHLAVGKISIGYHDMDGKSKKNYHQPLKISTVSRKIESF